MAKSVHYSVVATRAAERFATLPAPVRPILRLCDGTRDLRAIVAESELRPADTERVVDRLLTLGLVVALPQKRARRDTPPAVSAWIAAAPRPSAPPSPPVEPERPPAAVERAALEVEPPVIEARPPHGSGVDAARAVTLPIPEVVRQAALAAAAAALPAPVLFTDEEEAFFSQPLPESLPWDEDAR